MLQGHKKVAAMWGNSGLRWEDFVPRNQVEQFLVDKVGTRALKQLDYWFIIQGFHLVWNYQVEILRYRTVIGEYCCGDCLKY